MKIKSFLVLFFFVIPFALSDLQIGFYNSTCRDAETITRASIQIRIQKEKSVAAHLLNLHFRDCFVRGCDASILIETTEDNIAEKNAAENIFVRGFDVIDEIKGSLENVCPSAVSCADIIALATRDAVALAGGPTYQVPTGRRDGLVSKAQDAHSLPQPDSSVDVAVNAFAAKGLSGTEMVTLLGAHTVGVAHCRFFKGRFSETEPPMDPELKDKLEALCNNTVTSFEPSAFMDQNTSFAFDNEFYNQILKDRGILRLDQLLALDNSTSGIVNGFGSNRTGFLESFAKAIVKMGSIDVLVGNEGEIRKNCPVVNKPS